MPAINILEVSDESTCNQSDFLHLTVPYISSCRESSMSFVRFSQKISQAYGSYFSAIDYSSVKLSED